MEWMLLKVGEGVSYVCQLLAGQSQVFIVGVMVGGIIVATGHKKLGIKEAAQPIVDAIIELANPVSYACMIKGAMQVATGDEVKGKASMKNALMGYLVVKFTPQLFEFLDGLTFFK